MGADQRGRGQGHGRGRHRRLVTVGAITALLGAGVVAGIGAGPGRAAAADVPAANGVTTFGSLPDLAGQGGDASDVGIAATPDGRGYWLVGADGGVFAFGDAGFYGSEGGKHLNAPVVGIAATPDGRGYWLVAADGGVFAFGDATFYGSEGGQHLNAPVVGMAADGDAGYLLVAADGGVFRFGTAPYFGSEGGKPLNAPVVGMTLSPGAGGYLLVAADGGVFGFGAAPFYGSEGGQHLNAPVTGMALAPGGTGYLLLGGDGGIFDFGHAPYYGSDGAGPARSYRAVGIAAAAGGYWIAYGLPVNPVPAIGAYVAGRSDNVTVEVDDLLTGQVYDFRPGVVEHTASTVKVDILATLLARAQAQGRGLTAAEQADAVPMIEDSNDDAADALWVEDGYQNVAAFERGAGMTSTVPPSNGIWGETTTTAADRIKMVDRVIFPNSQLTDASRAYILNLMEHITPSQDWGATGGVPAGVTVALKNGFSIIRGWQINDEGWVDGDGRDYVIGMLSDGNPSEQYGIDTLNAVSSIVWSSLAP